MGDAGLNRSNAGASERKRPATRRGVLVDSPSANQCFFFSSFFGSDFAGVVPEVDIVPAAAVGVVPVAVAVAGVVPIVPLVDMVEVMDVSVDDIVPVVPVMAVSVAIVDDVVVVMVVSVAAVSVLAFSCFLQPTAKIATATRAMRVITKDFFMKFSSSSLTGGIDVGM
jgi:hypothetical protein